LVKQKLAWDQCRTDQVDRAIQLFSAYQLPG
jgi:hypothetical protein